MLDTQSSTFDLGMAGTTMLVPQQAADNILLKRVFQVGPNMRNGNYFPKVPVNKNCISASCDTTDDGISHLRDRTKNNNAQVECNSLEPATVY